MTLISPRRVVAAVARQVPAECLPHPVVIGSLAPAHQLLDESDETAVRTKDIDCILVPRIEAIPQGQAVADALLAAGWQHPSTGPYLAPGTAKTPDEDLPVVRLYPPDSAEWFVELLTVQDAADQMDRAIERVVRALLASEGDLREALEVSRAGLLASVPTTADEFRIVAERLLVDAVEPLEEAARRASGGV